MSQKPCQAKNKKNLNFFENLNSGAFPGDEVLKGPL
jgi:hypothetical protein